MRTLRHAFAVEKAGAATPTASQGAIIDRLCREIVRRRMVTPALMVLEMSRPLNYLGAQAMHFFTPLIGAVTDTAGFEQMAQFLEKRGSIEFLCGRIDFFQHVDDSGDDATRQAGEDENRDPSTNH